MKDVLTKSKTTPQNPKPNSNPNSNPDPQVTEINVEEFFDFTRYHPGLLYPAFLLQHQMQVHILGEGFWSHHAKTR